MVRLGTDQVPPPTDAFDRPRGLDGVVPWFSFAARKRLVSESIVAESLLLFLVGGLGGTEGTEFTEVFV